MKRANKFRLFFISRQFNHFLFKTITNMDKEIRQFNIEFKANHESRTIEGVAIPFNVLSPNREGFREMIDPHACDGIIEISDIKFLYNHDERKGFLARRNKGKGSLSIEVKEDGVHFSFKAKQDNLSNYVFERLSDGDLSEMSWAFTVAEETWEKKDDGIYERIITRFERLYDFSVVDNSYYGIEGAVGCKRFAELQEADRLALEKAKQEEENRASEDEKPEDKPQEDKPEEPKKEEVEEKGTETSENTENRGEETNLDDYYKKIHEEYDSLIGDDK